MKKSNKEILDFFGLKVGDKVIIEGHDDYYVIAEENGIEYAQRTWKKWGVTTDWNFVNFIFTLLGNEYEIITPKKKIGDMKCERMLCSKCPLRAIDCDAESNTLYEVLEKYRKQLNTFDDSLKPFEKTFIASIKAELDKEVEE